MTKTLHRNLAIALVALLVPFAPGTLAEPNDAPDGKEIVSLIVGQHTMPTNVTEGGSYHGHKVLKVRPNTGYVVIEAPREAAQGLLNDPNVRYVEEDVVLHDMLDYTPNDTRLDDQDGVHVTRAPSGWEKTRGSTNAAVCVVDTGVRSSHEDLTGSRYAGGYDFVFDDTTPNDAEGHGTHVTGIAAATIHNSKGVSGMGNVKFYHARIFDANRDTTITDTADGIEWCADNTITRTVINMSFGTSSDSTTIHDAVKYAYNTKNKLLVASAGNDYGGAINYPAKYSEVIAVTSTTDSDTLAAHSNKGAEAEISAPGESILSTCYGSNTDYCTKTGTSMASPAVAGAAALLWSYETSLSKTTLRSRLQTSALDLGTTGRDSSFGYGRLDVHCLMYSISPCKPFYNDDFADAVAFSTPGYKTMTYTSNGVEAHEPKPCGSILATGWFTYKAPADGTMVVDTFGSTYDTVLAAYTGSSLGSLSQKACNDDASGTQSKVTVAVTKGTTYRLQAGGYQGAQGSLKITLAFTASDCGVSGDAGNTFSTARSISVPKSCTGYLSSPDNEDWYRFSVALGDTVRATMTPPPGNNFNLCLYDPSGTQVDCSFAGSGQPDGVEELVATTAGSWRVRVYRSSGSGVYDLDVSSCLGAGVLCV